jgi:hypothetical protein
LQTPVLSFVHPATNNNELSVILEGEPFSLEHLLS